MGRSEKRRGPAALAAALLTTLAGCGDGAPSVSSSRSEATVHGTVKYKGKPVTEGEIVFDPRNTGRRDASIASSRIGPDGSYTVKTLVGENSVNFKLPKLGARDQSLGYTTYQFDAAGGDNSRDFELPKP